MHHRVPDAADYSPPGVRLSPPPRPRSPDRFSLRDSQLAGCTGLGSGPKQEDPQTVSGRERLGGAGRLHSLWVENLSRETRRANLAGTGIQI